MVGLTADPTHVSVRDVPQGGETFTVETLREMRRLSMEDAHHPDLVRLARAAVRQLPNKDVFGEADRIFGLVKRSVRYVYDPNGLEWVQRPTVTLFAEGQGDCDDHATAVAALAMALGHGASFITVAGDPRREPGSWSHVYAAIGVRKAGVTYWVPADTIHSGSTLAWEPTAITARQRWIVKAA